MVSAYSIYHYVGFLFVVFICLWVDLHLHKDSQGITLRGAFLWSVFWIFLALLFGVYIGVSYGLDHASLYLSGYLLEKSLSVDNLFVIMAIFSAFAIPEKYQHRTLYYGILGALILRILFVAAGTTLIEFFGAYALTVFGVFVLWSAWKMWQQLSVEESQIEDYSHHWSVRWTQKYIPVSPQLHGDRFFVKEKADGSDSIIWKATPLFLCLIVVELSDVLFAFDSIPAIIAITQDPFLVYTSNIFAVLGLRSLYFLMAAAKKFLCHLEKAVIIILVFIGVKMLVNVFFGVHLPALLSLAIVLGVLTLGIVASWLFPPKKCDVIK